VIQADIALQTLLAGFPQTPRLHELRRNLDAQERTQSETREWVTWQQNWDARVKPLVEADFQPATNAFLEEIALRHRLVQRESPSPD